MDLDEESQTDVEVPEVRLEVLIAGLRAVRIQCNKSKLEFSVSPELCPVLFCEDVQVNPK